jgi:UDP-N-acetylglucosamine 1-carboxyvinyltransferase
MAATFVIEGTAGEKTLSGTIPVYGAKNAVLPVIAASLLIEGESTFENVPGIADIDSMSRILEGMGAFVSRNGRSLTVNAKELHNPILDPAASKAIRASVLLIGPVLARTGRVTFPHPGGDVIGERPIDIFISSFQKLGAVFSETADTYTLSAPNGLSGGEIFFPVVTVTGTETVLIAACLAKAPVTLKNCAMEPEVVATAEYLKSCGARIEGEGTPTIVIHPTSLMPPHTFRIMPDRIEAASFLTLGALAAKELTITDIEPAHLDAVIERLRSMGVEVTVTETSVTVRSPGIVKPVRLQTREYPGFPTDAQAPMMVLLTQANGESVVIESIFDGRLNYTSELVKMGAEIMLASPHRARIRGKTPLLAADIATPDIRAGLSFMLAAIIARGTSRIANAHLIDRGYESIEKRLSSIGVKIRRE